MNELEEFLRQTADVLGARVLITEFGISRTLSVELNQRIVEISTNGPMLWLVADFDWPGFPTDGTFISWAPVQSLLRAKLLEGPGSSRVAGRSEFDDKYLIQGPSAGRLFELQPEVIRILLANEHLRPHVTGQAISQEPLAWCIRRHIRCEPSLFSGPDRSGGVKLGTERFTPDYAALWAKELSTMVTSLARATNSRTQ